jgi:polyisoprenoid-binding protein YceI
MKKLFVSVSLLASALLYSCGGNTEEASTSTLESNDAAEVSYALNIDSSLVAWKGTMISVKSHNGIIKLTEGSFSVKGTEVTAGSFTADLTSMSTLDANYNEDYTSAKLIGHLSSDDFFATAQYPTATFLIKSVEGNTATGDLTVRGVTKEEKVTDIVVEQVGDAVKASGKLTFDRQKYGVAWSNPMKEMILSDDVELEVVLVGQK